MKIKKYKVKINNKEYVIKRDSDGKFIMPEELKKFDGWHSPGLKPSYEPIILAMKPCEKSFVNNALKHGVAGLNIDGGRIDYKNNFDKKEACSLRPNAKKHTPESNTFCEFSKYNRLEQRASPQGRFPANIIIDKQAGEMIDAQSGESVSSGGRTSLGYGSTDIYGDGKEGYSKDNPGLGDSGGASRFFYCAKASKLERNLGCDGLCLDELSMNFCVIKLSSGETIWEETNIIQGEEKAKQLADMVQSIKRGIEEYGIKNKNGIDLNTMLFGNKTLEKYLLDTKYITRMKISSTTSHQILSLLHHYTIKDNTQGVSLKKMDGGSPVEIVAKKNTLKITMKENQGFLLGAKPVVLKMQLKIKEREKKNIHSTVKPLALLTYLCKLTQTPTKGSVLDPFMGSGTTGMACKLTGRKFIGIEREREYYEIAKARTKAIRGEMKQKLLEYINEISDNVSEEIKNTSNKSGEQMLFGDK